MTVVTLSGYQLGLSSELINHPLLGRDVTHAGKAWCAFGGQCGIAFISHFIFRFSYSRKIRPGSLNPSQFNADECGTSWENSHLCYKLSLTFFQMLLRTDAVRHASLKRTDGTEGVFALMRKCIGQWNCE